MSRSRKLAETTDFVDLYTYHCGESEIPFEYQLWSGLALLAAAVADRVWYSKFRGKKLAPNLYVALIGPSANGKGEAIDTAMRLALEHPKIATYNGKASPQYLMQYMSHSHDTEDGTNVNHAKIFLVTPELSMALAKGDAADTFIKHMTELYTGRPYPLTDGTISRGHHVLKDYCCNWILGTTLEWMRDVVPAEAISGGFFGRIVGVYHGYVKDRRIEIPRYPSDYDEVVSFLHAKLTELCEIDGEFTLTPKAQDIMTTWYQGREWPADDALAPAFKRQHDLVLKLAMLLSLSESLSLVISRVHIVKAQQLSEGVIRRLSEIQAAAAAGPATKGIAFVQQYLRGIRRPAMRTEILKRFYAKGMGDTEMLSLALRTLEDSGVVAHQQQGRGVQYAWVGRKRMPQDPSDNGASAPAASPD